MKRAFLAAALMTLLVGYANALLLRTSGGVQNTACPTGFTCVSPSGVDDTSALTAACATYPVWLQPGTYKISSQVTCSQIYAHTGNCWFWNEGVGCQTILQEIAGTWTSGQGVISAPNSGVPPYYQGFQVTCPVSNGADGVNGFVFGGNHGIDFNQTRVFRCSDGYHQTGGLIQMLHCFSCAAQQNYHWGFYFSNISDSVFDGNFQAANNAVGVGSSGCGYGEMSITGIGVLIMGGQIEDTYCSSGYAGGWGLVIGGGSAHIRVVGNKFDQNNVDIMVNSTTTSGIGYIELTGNDSTTTPGEANIYATPVSLWFTGGNATYGVKSAGNTWKAPFKADTASGQLDISSFDDIISGGFLCCGMTTGGGSYAYAGDQTTADYVAPTIIRTGPSPNGWPTNGGWYALQTITGAATAPAGTTSTTGVMLGLNTTITPLTSRIMNVTAVGTMTSSAAGDGAQVQLYYGTGTPPANGAAITGTPIGYPQIADSSGTSRHPFALNTNVEMPHAVLAPYWFDLVQTAVNGGTATLSNVTLTVWEQ